MDLVTLARRFAHSFVFPDKQAYRSLPLSARGIIGDGFTAALVSADGAIDWLCMPRFDSPTVFARVLDADRGGSMAVRPADAPFESLQSYDVDTNVLESFLTTQRGALRVLDFMPWSNDPRASIHEVHRRVTCVSGEVETEIVFDPRFDYARDVPQLHFGEHGVLAQGMQGERLVLSVSRRHLNWTRLPNGGARATVTVRPGAPLWCVLSWDHDSIEPVEAHRPFEHLRITRHQWRKWSSNLTYDGPWRHHVLRSALTLKTLMYAPTGAVVAAPTTSLPEWIGGGRNWDYRFSWARDSALAIRAANLIGYGVEARDFYHFLRDAVDARHGLELMYTIDGGPVPEEQELTHLVGAFGSSPVRIGNGARDQVQLDTTGAVVDAAHLFERFGGRLTLRAWHKLEHILKRAERNWMEPDHGIWEPRHGMRHNVHSKLMNWLAMDRGAHLAATFGGLELAERWRSCAEEIRQNICERGVDSNGRHFVSIYGEERPDATLLLMPLYGFLPDADPRLLETVRWVRQELADGPFLYRYRGDDGVGGAEGAFVLCGFWLAEALALQGLLDDAVEVFSAHVEAANHLGLLSEEIDPKNKTLLGNFPQAFSHLGLINAALRIDLALRLRDERSADAPHLVGSRPSISNLPPIRQTT